MISRPGAEGVIGVDVDSIYTGQVNSSSRKKGILNLILEMSL
jgi:hypothetical protein